MKYAMYLLMLITLAACSGPGTSSSSSSSGAGLGPSLALSTDYDWDENTTFSLKIQAGGSSPTQYKFAYTADAQFFNLDATSGLLTSKAPFDFEIPINPDNTYTLSILAIDAQNRSASKTIKIHLKDVAEYAVALDFPVDGANMAGAADKIHLRGHIANDGKKLAQIPSNLNILVNGQAATIDSKTPGMWLAEVALPKSENSFTVSLMSNAKLQSSKNINIYNRIIPWAKASDGHNPIMVDVDITGSKVSKRSLPDNGSPLLLASTQQALFKDCDYFERPELNKSSTQAALICKAKNTTSNLLFTCNLNNNICSGLGSFSSRTVRWIQDQYLLLVSDDAQFTLIDTSLKSKKTLTLNALEIRNFETSGSRVYVAIRPNTDSQLGQQPFEQISFDINAYMTNQNSQQAIVDTRSEIVQLPTYDRFAISDGFLFTLATDALYKTNLADGSSIKIEIDGLRSQTKFQPGSIVYAANHTIVIAVGKNLISYDNSTGQVRTIDADSSLLGQLYVDISPDSNTLMLLDRSNNRYAPYDLKADSLGAVSIMSAYNLDKYPFDILAVDWSTHHIYRGITFDWVGIAPSFEAHILGYDPVKKEEYPVLTGNELTRYLGYSGQTRVGTITLDPDTHEIWFVVFFSNYNNDGTSKNFKQFICTINPATKAFKIIKEFNVSSTFDEIYISRFNTQLKGVGTGHWAYSDQVGGSVETLNGAGQMQSLLPSRSPYFSTSRGVLNGGATQLYNVGYLVPEGQANPDLRRGELFSIDLATKTRKVIASESQGLGVSLGWIEPVFDANRDIIIQGSDGHLLLIDTVTGDRVLKPLRLPQ